jgi:hypothetical protein
VKSNDTSGSTGPAVLRVRCEWCGEDGGRLCSSLSDRDLLLHYYSGVRPNCNRQVWQHRRDLFRRADLQPGKETGDGA